MRTSTYKKTIFITLFIAFVSSVILGFLLLQSGPRVRLMKLDRDPSVYALTNNSTLALTFDRPIEQRDYTDSISFEPEVTFSVETLPQNLVVTFQENLSHKTDYTIRLSNDVADQSGVVMKNEYISTFSTYTPRYAYIERNYGVEASSPQRTDAEDHIKRAILGSEPEILFSHPIIKMFAINNDYLVVVTQENDGDVITALRLDDMTQVTEKKLNQSRIATLALSPLGFIALYSVQPEFQSVSREYYNQYSNRIESLNLETGLIESIYDTKNKPIRGTEISMDTYGQAALALDPKQNYLAFSPFADYEPTFIGSYSESFGFNDDGNEIIFRTQEGFLRYDVVSGKTNKIDTRVEGFIQTVDARRNKMYLAANEFLAGDSLGKIYELQDWMGEPALVWEERFKDGQTLKDFSQSYEGALLAIQSDPQQCRYDQIISNSQCEQTGSFIYDVSSKEVVANYRGFDTVWLP